jgi:hypothetical protein
MNGREDDAVRGICTAVLEANEEEVMGATAREFRRLAFALPSEGGYLGNYEALLGQADAVYEGLAEGTMTDMALRMAGNGSGQAHNRVSACRLVFTIMRDGIPQEWTLNEHEKRDLHTYLLNTDSAHAQQEMGTLLGDSWYDRLIMESIFQKRIPE